MLIPLDLWAMFDIVSRGSQECWCDHKPLEDLCEGWLLSQPVRTQPAPQGRCPSGSLPHWEPTARLPGGLSACHSPQLQQWIWNISTHWMEMHFHFCVLYFVINSSIERTPLSTGVVTSTGGTVLLPVKHSPNQPCHARNIVLSRTRKKGKNDFKRESILFGVHHFTRLRDVQQTYRDRSHRSSALRLTWQSWLNGSRSMWN